MTPAETSALYYVLYVTCQRIAYAPNGGTYLMRQIFATYCPEDEGGALFNAGILEVYDTDFKENVAGDSGLALRNGHSAELSLSGVTFSDNLRKCYPEEYNTADVSRLCSRSHILPRRTRTTKFICHDCSF